MYRRVRIEIKHANTKEAGLLFRKPPQLPGKPHPPVTLIKNVANNDKTIDPAKTLKSPPPANQQQIQLFNPHPNKKQIPRIKDKENNADDYKTK